MLDFFQSPSSSVLPVEVHQDTLAPSIALSSGELLKLASFTNVPTSTTVLLGKTGEYFPTLGQNPRDDPPPPPPPNT